jgi:hypothetical protein
MSNVAPRTERVSVSGEALASKTGLLAAVRAALVYHSRLARANRRANRQEAAAICCYLELGSEAQRSGVITDFSPLGVRLRGKHALVPGTVLKLNVDLECGAISTWARVVWVNAAADQFGAEFVALGQHTAERLAAHASEHL